MNDFNLSKRGDGWLLLHTFTTITGPKRRSKTLGKKLGITSKQQATAAAYKWIEETQADYDKNNDPNTKNFTFKQFYTQEWLKVNQHPNATYERYISALNNPALKPVLNTKLTQINFKFMHSFFTDLAHKKVKNRKTKKMQYPKFDYLNNYKKAISNVLNLAIKYQLIDLNPTLHINLREYLTTEAKNESTTRAVNRDAYEINELNIIMSHIAEVDPSFQRMCKIMVSLGLRPGELAALDLKDSIDFRNSSITINKAITYTKKDGVHAKSTKTGNNRIIFFNQDVQKILIAQIIYINGRNKITDINLVQHFWLFSHSNNTPYKPAWLGKKWTKMLDGLNVHKYDFYALRHTFASQMLNNGFDAAVIASHMGHSIETFFRYYVHPLESEQKKLGVFNMFEPK